MVRFFTRWGLPSLGGNQRVEFPQETIYGLFFFSSGQLDRVWSFRGILTNSITAVVSFFFCSLWVFLITRIVRIVSNRTNAGEALFLGRGIKTLFLLLGIRFGFCEKKKEEADKALSYWSLGARGPFAVWEKKVLACTGVHLQG